MSHRPPARHSALLCIRRCTRRCRATVSLQPPDLRRWPVALLIPRRYPEDDRRFARVVHVRNIQRLIVHRRLVVRPTINTHKGELRGGTLAWLRHQRRRWRTNDAQCGCCGLCTLHGQVDAVLEDLALRRWWWFPTEVRTVATLRDLDGGRSTGEARQTGLKGDRLKRRVGRELKRS